MFAFIKKVFVVAMSFLSGIAFNGVALSCNALECNSMNNQECKVRSEIININSNEPLFYPYSVKIDKCSGSCNNIDDPYAKLCVPDTIKNIIVKVFNLMRIANETRYVE